jgi:cysteine desulfurase family protein
MMIYLDNAATSWPKPDCVPAEMRRFLDEDAANPGRSGHRMAVAAEKMLDRVRAALTRFVDGTDPARLVFTLNGTDALNMAIKGVLREGDHVITSTLEHNSVSRPLQAMADAGFISLTRVPMADGGYIDPDAVEQAFQPQTRLVVCTHAGNVLGTIQPAEAIGRIVRERDALFLLDAAQSIGLVPISVRRFNVDLLAFPGHKSLLGPTGTGGLYLGERVDPKPWREGGTGGDSSSPTQPHLYPYWLEGGTPNTVGIAGLGAAVAYVTEQTTPDALTHEQALIARLVDALRDDDRFTLLGDVDPSRHVGAISLTVRDLDPPEVGAILDESFGIAVRPGLHCAPYTHRELGTFPDGTVRVSPGRFSTEADIDALIAALRELAM